MFYYEVTLACDLVCKHCRASAQEKPHPDELSTDQAKALLDQVAGFPRRPMLVMTGGDPLKRPDLLELIRHAVSVGLQLALTPSATPLATFEAFEQVRAGRRAEPGHQPRRRRRRHPRRLPRLAGQLRAHDARCSISPAGWKWPCRSTRRSPGATSRQVDAIADLLASARGSPCGRFSSWCRSDAASRKSASAPEEYEQVFERLWHHARRQPYAVKTTEAPHYRRFVLQQGGDPLAEPNREDGGVSARRGHRAPLGVGDGKGIMFVSHTGEIYPAGFLPLCCGRFPEIR